MEKKFGELLREEKIALFTAWVDGKAIEYRSLEYSKWEYIRTPNWYSWGEYRVKPHVPDYIDWGQVHTDYQYMARDSDERAYLFKKNPSLGVVSWVGTSGATVTQSSYVKGEVDWKDSLVKRP